MQTKCLFFFALAILLACNENKVAKTGTNEGSASQQLVGEWNNLSIKIDVHSKGNNADSSEMIEVNRPEWEARLKIKPIRTFFREDSTWNSAHYNLKDSLVYDPSGKWWIENNKLVMLQQSPSMDTTIYAITVKKDTATFEALVDWDMDGQKDDHYFGEQIKAKRQ